MVLFGLVQGGADTAVVLVQLTLLFSQKLKIWQHLPQVLYLYLYISTLVDRYHLLSNVGDCVRQQTAGKSPNKPPLLVALSISVRKKALNSLGIGLV